MIREDNASHHTNSGLFRRTAMRAHRGAALIYALAAVVIISLLVLGTGRLVAYHFQTEETSRSYSRAIHIAESAANWQLQRMSRTNLSDNTTNTPGRLSLDQFRASDPYTSTGSFALPPDDIGGVQIPGQAQIQLTMIDGSTAWQPPYDFNMLVVGKDTAAGTTRGLAFSGTGTGLTERYTLFAQNQLRFEATIKPARLISGYIGTNGTINATGPKPVGVAPPQGQFGGCRLAPGATVGDGILPTTWDMPRLPTAVVWPTITEFTGTLWNGSDPNALAAANDNAHISYRKADGSFVPFDTAPTQLTDAEFAHSDYTANGSPQRTIRLEPPNSGNKNLFYFTNIQMGANDILVLDLRANDQPIALHILINNSNITQDSVKITNVARYVANPARFDLQTPKPAFFWLNNTNKPIEFAPTLAPNAPLLTYPSDADNSTYAYSYNLEPGILGCAYGLNTLSASNNQAGDIIVHDAAFPVFVNCAVGNHVTLKGNVRVRQGDIEDAANPYRYVLYYRIKAGYSERQWNDFSSPRTPVIDYGTFNN